MLLETNKWLDVENTICPYKTTSLQLSLPSNIKTRFDLGHLPEIYHLLFMTAIINAEWLAFAVNCKNRLSPPSAEGSHCAGTGTNAERHGWSKCGESVLVLSHNGGIHVTDPPLLLRLKVQRGRRGGEICRGNSLGGPRTKQCPLATAGLPCSLTHSSYGWLNQA